MNVLGFELISVVVGERNKTVSLLAFWDVAAEKYVYHHGRVFLPWNHKRIIFFSRDDVKT